MPSLEKIPMDEVNKDDDDETDIMVEAQAQAELQELQNVTEPQQSRAPPPHRSGGKCEIRQPAATPKWASFFTRSKRRTLPFFRSLENETDADPSDPAAAAADDELNQPERVINEMEFLEHITVGNMLLPHLDLPRQEWPSSVMGRPPYEFATTNSEACSSYFVSECCQWGLNRCTPSSMCQRCALGLGMYNGPR
jgi:hypothetical protein